MKEGRKEGKNYEATRKKNRNVRREIEGGRKRGREEQWFVRREREDERNNQDVIKCKIFEL